MTTEYEELLALWEDEMRTKSIGTVEAQEMAVELIKKLDGLSIGQAEWVLREAGDLIRSTHSVDVNGRGFVLAIEELRALSLGSS